MLGNSPVWYGEWALSTQFNATDDFLRKWADAQKLVYSRSAGWLVRLWFPRCEEELTLIPR
jgi:glucan endo-1,6-beta-glucosidase